MYRLENKRLQTKRKKRQQKITNTKEPIRKVTEKRMLRICRYKMHNPGNRTHYEEQEKTGKPRNRIPKKTSWKKVYYMHNQGNKIL